jgi:hypothetical protein
MNSFESFGGNHPPDRARTDSQHHRRFIHAQQFLTVRFFPHVQFF